MQIPILNIYYLLSYAWGHLEEDKAVKVAAENADSLLDLLCRVLIGGTGVLLRHGIARDYISVTDEVASVKGKFQISPTIKSNSLMKGKTICAFDDYSPDILLNRIILSTIRNLIFTLEVDQGNKKQLLSLFRRFPNLSEIQITDKTFSQIKLNRNNIHYDLLIKVCKLIHDCLLPNEEAGIFSFADFKRDKQMNLLFEKFILNFYKKKRPDLDVGSPYIKWKIPTDDGNKKFLPIMKTDIVLAGPDRKIIIDAKYYQKTLKGNFGQDKVNSEHLYQIYSYLMNQREENDPTSLDAIGILLYPVSDQNYDIDFCHEDHNIFIRTVNLNEHWSEIEKRLLSIVN